MKLARYKTKNGPALAAVVDEKIVPIHTFATMMDLISAGAEGLERVKNEIDAASSQISLDTVELLCPIEKPGKYLAIGLNYGKHRDEGAEIGVVSGATQMWFNKQTTCLSGPFDTIDPGVTKQLDYEVELGVVIGKRTKGIKAAAAQDHIFGYFVANDVSARDWQFASATVTVGKSFDSHGPIGPWIITSDEVPDPHALELRCMVNGEIRQSSNTREMIADIWEQIEHLSTAFTLEPGDLIATGTPEGVGVAMNPPVFLQPGDVVRCEIDGIGAIENRVALSAA
jgi:2-keto-4-pentenoate hydratase/2-oxohepta-3-ene-1,7-dioic acid hydratase in catechol pathway